MGRWISKNPLDLTRIIDETSNDASGALLIFAGTVRNNNDGKEVVSMTYEAHESMAEKVLREIEIETENKFDIHQCRLQHRIGLLRLGDVSVYVVVRSGHRDEGYKASRYAIDELKRRTPIWKEEHYVDGESQYLDGTPLNVET